MLQAQLRVWVPAGIEKNENWLNVMLVGNREKCLDSLTETRSILLPEQVVQEDTHRVHADGLRPA